MLVKAVELFDSAGEDFSTIYPTATFVYYKKTCCQIVFCTADLLTLKGDEPSENNIR